MRYSVFSRNSKDMVSETYPQHTPKIKVKPHQMLQFGSPHQVLQAECAVSSVSRVILGLLQKRMVNIAAQHRRLNKAGLGLVIVDFGPAYPLSPSVPIFHETKQRY